MDVVGGRGQTCEGVRRVDTVLLTGESLFRRPGDNKKGRKFVHP